MLVARERPCPPYSLGKQIPANPPRRGPLHPVPACRLASAIELARGLTRWKELHVGGQPGAGAQPKGFDILLSGARRCHAPGLLSEGQSAGDALAVLGRSLHSRARSSGGPSEVQVQVVLPGDPDAAVKLDAVLEEAVDRSPT